MRIQKEPFSKCNFDRGLQKKPGLNALRLQFCSDDRSRALPFCFSEQPPGFVCSEGRHISRESFCSMPAGRPPKRDPCSCPRSSTHPPPPPRERAGCESGPGSNTMTHRPPWTCVLHTADHLRGRAGWGCKGDREGRAGGEEGWDALPPRKIPAAGCIAEPWGQA